MVSRSREHLHPTLVKVYDEAERIWKERFPNRPAPFLTQTYRSASVQNELYEQGRTTPGQIVTKARGGESPHNYLPSLAFDIAFLNPNKTLNWSLNLFQDFAAIVREVSKEVMWGGRFVSFKDNPHFEMKNWKQIAK